MRKPEVLAPAGSPEALQAAVRCGAAAVYFGVGDFNARRAAQNFSLEELPQTVAYCHSRGVKAYLALNTLLRQEELDEAVHTAVSAAKAGVDALIIQDVGLARRLRAVLPTMPLHASTQLSCHTPAGVKFLRDAGFCRVVLAREMSREEIAACSDLGVELEAFVHGALCMSVSGQCYFSAMLGGRSGNRGACAQTCRLPFEPTDDRPRTCPTDKAALSLKDNCLAAYIQELTVLGVASLKIEGRMKRPEYVAAACRVYAAAARGETVSRERLDALQKVFSRSGFTDGYYTAQLGSGMFGTRRREDVTAAADVLKELAHTYHKELPLVGIRMDFTADETACTLTVSDDDGHAVTLTNEGAQRALNRSLDHARVKEQLCKTGGTPFFTEQVSCTIGEGLTLPLSRLNALRRQALEELLVQRSTAHAPVCEPTALPPALPPCSHGEHRLFVRLSTADQWTADQRADLVFFPLSTPVDTLRQLVAKQPVGVEIPRGLFGQEETVAQALKAAAQAGAVAALCGNVGAIPLAKEAGLTPIGGFGLNITNEQALAFYAEHGLAAATLSMELTFPQIAALPPAPLPTGILLYGRQPLMLTRQCPRKAALGSCASCGHRGITDRTGTVFPVMCAGGCAEILNSVPLYWADRLREVPPRDFTLLHFTTETPEEVAAVVAAYQQGATAPAAITRGLYRRGVE